MNKDKKRELLVTLADANFIEQSKQLFSSVYWNSGWKGDYMLLAFDVPESELAWFLEKGILIYRCDPLTDESVVGQRGHPRAVLSKFYLLKSYFKQWSNVVFLDADIIVRASLDDLTSIRGFHAPNAHGINLKKEFNFDDSNVSVELKKSFKFNEKAFNTGILAFSTDIISDDSFDIILDLFRKYGRVSTFGEEGILNLFFYKKWQELSIVYNQYPEYMFVAYRVKHFNLKSIIIHFVGSRKQKPWQPTSNFYEEWSINRERADQIDLSNRQNAVKIWSKEEIKKYERYLSRRAPFFWIFLQIDRYIGKVGLLIRYISPVLYEKVRIKR